MKKMVFVGAAMVASGWGITEEIRVDAPVRAVTLYHDMAELLRQVAVDLPSVGQHRIIVRQAVADTRDLLQPTISGATLLGVSIEPDWAAVESPLQQQIDNVSLALEDNAQAISVNKAMMQGLSGRLSRDGDFAVVQSQLATLQQSHSTLLRERAKWQRTLSSLQKQQEWLGDVDEPARVVIFDVDTSEAGAVTLAWRARTDKAYWLPSSEWSLDSEHKRVAMSATANVVQKTGFDWSDVSIVLAVVPPEYVAPPSLAPQVVRAVEPVVNQPFVSMMSMKAPAPMMAEASVTPVRLEQRGVDMQVALSDHYDLPSGLSSRRITYWQDEVDADVYSAVYDWAWPTDTAMLMATWTMPDEMNLLTGEVTLYRDGNRVTQLNENGFLAAGSKQSIGFGEDPQLMVTISHPPEYTENQGLINKSHALSQRTIVEVENHAREEKTVRVYSRLPVSAEESVAVTPVWSPQPNEENVDKVTGLMMWQHRLAPQSLWQVETGFDIEYPEGKQLIGL